jgi:cellulose synthase/poly-beta-1,6-N-acetylglucosamine synthase-like glycosyltransferase
MKMPVELFPYLLRIVEVLALFYALLIMAYTFGWYKLKNSRLTSETVLHSISILIAARNEEKNISNLLSDLIQQDYPKHLLEVIVADDHSEDDSAVLVEKFAIENSGLTVMLIKVNGFGKKAAIREAAKIAKGEIILFTDADCRVGKEWVSTMSNKFCFPESKLMLGPVRMENDGHIFGKLQSLEFLSLIASTAGSCGIAYPAMANGANLAVRRSMMEEFLDNQHGKSHASGDDVFLLFSVLKKYGSSAVGFALFEEAIVSTKALSRPKEFFSQRLRWVSKSKSYSHPAVIVPAVIVLLFDFALLLMFVAAFFYPFLFAIWGMFSLLKFMIDYPLLRSAADFMQRQYLIRLAFPFEFIYPFYIVFTALAGNILAVKWKGRKIT